MVWLDDVVKCGEMWCGWDGWIGNMNKKENYSAGQCIVLREARRRKRGRTGWERRPKVNKEKCVIGEC